MTPDDLAALVLMAFCLWVCYASYRGPRPPKARVTGRL